MKTILFINLRSYSLERVEPLIAAKNLGLKVVLLADSKPDLIDKELISDFIITNTYNTENAVKEVLAYHQQQPISAVMTWADKDVELVATIADKLNLTALSIESAHYVRNKYQLRQQLGKDFPYSPLFYSVKNLEDLQRGLEYVGLPAILKPVGASGSKSIIKIQDKNEAKKAFELVTQTTTPTSNNIFSYYPNEYTLESLLLGDEISIDGYIHQGKISIVGAIDKNVTEDFCLEYHSYFPSKYSQSLSKEIRQVTYAVIDKLALDNCCFHLECKVYNNQIKVIEIAGRAGGGFINSHLIPKARGLSLMEVYIKNALGEKTTYPEFDEDINCFTGMYCPLAKKAGKITALPDLNPLLEIEGVDYILPIKKIGSSVRLPPEDFAPHLSFILASSHNYTQLVSTLEKVSELYIKEVKYEE